MEGVKPCRMLKNEDWSVLHSPKSIAFLFFPSLIKITEIIPNEDTDVQKLAQEGRKNLGNVGFQILKENVITSVRKEKNSIQTQHYVKERSNFKLLNIDTYIYCQSLI